MKIKFLSFALIFSLSTLPTAPAFAQLGQVTAPTVEPAPVSEPVSTPSVEALVSGYFGNLTKNAVMQFQKKYTIIPVSGYVGYKTRHLMRELTGF